MITTRSALVVLLTFASADAAAAQSAGAAAASADRLLADIKYLADDAREGRGPNTAGLDSAGAYIARQFRAAGLAPGLDDGYFQRFAVDSSAPALIHAGVGTVHTRNVIALIPGKGRLRGQAVVVGAHYDHLGRGGTFALDNPDSTGIVHNGADDNASGTAAVMEIGRILAPRARAATDARAVILVAFSAEELGDLGSQYYVQHPIRPMDSTYAMVNLDMVGRLADNKLIVYGVETAKEFPALVDSLNAARHFALTASGDGFGSSDHAMFTAAKVPVLFFFTGLHQDYHRTTDDWQKINAPGEARVVDFAADAVWALATRPDSLTFVEVAPPPQVSGGGYGAYLGTIPDMASSPGGVRIQGVRAGSPAEAGGLKGGDILVRIGDKTVANLYDMTDALRAHQPGEVVDIVVKRGEKTDTLKVTLGKRG